MLLTTARLLFPESLFVSCRRGRKRNRFMAVKTENSAILLFRFDYHFLLPCLGKVGSTPKDDAFHASGRVDVERPEAVGISLGMWFRYYKLRTTQMITQISTMVPTSPYPNM